MTSDTLAKESLAKDSLAKESENPVIAAVHRQKGLASQIGKELGITRNAVWMWKRVPVEHALKVAKFMKLPVHQVCPDYYPEPRKRSKPTRLQSSQQVTSQSPDRT